MTDKERKMGGAAKIAELDKQIAELWAQKEAVAREYNITLVRPEPDAYSEYYFNSKEDMLAWWGYCEEDVEHLNLENKFPGWFASTSLEG